MRIYKRDDIPLRDVISNSLGNVLSRWAFIGLFMILIQAGCSERSSTLLSLLPPEKTGVLFNNVIEETDSFNILFDEYIYNGGGVGVADINNDGWPDLYFAGNQVANRLYLNKGNFRFEDITDEAGVSAEDIWSSGIAMVDINQDGWMDMYVSATFKDDSVCRKNKLFVNQGLESGIPTFIDQAAEYGIDDDGHSTQGVFFDYDLDGDLDLYVLTNVFLGHRTMADENTNLIDKSSTIDKLYRNNGNGTFTNVSTVAGITLEGFGLGIAVLDVNKDRYPDLYISNDFVSSDILYVNNKDGTFTNQLEKYFKHISYASMGNDASDINNDGLVDIMTLEMLPSNIQRVKMMYSTTVFNRDRLIMNAGYYKQFLHNCLQFNNGNGTFSDIGYLLGIASTDWSWSTLFMDLDNDGYRDLAIANGFPRDVTDRDYTEHLREVVGLFTSSELLLPYIPEYKTKNFFFRNQEGHRFDNVSEKWGIQVNSYSNGAAFADLDNDGDLDYITNNINQPAFIFQNHLNEIYPDRNWIRLKLKGSPENRNGLGAKVTIYTHGNEQYYEFNPYRGYISSVDPVIHFGLDTCSLIDSLWIQWPLGKEQVLYDLPANQVAHLDFNDASDLIPERTRDPVPLFRDVTDSLNLQYVHQEMDFMDFRIQPLLPHMHSRLGPGLAVGDINGDRLDDFVAGNGRQEAITLFIQQPGGGFEEFPLIDTAEVEVTGLLLFDCDNDNDLDLYAVSGGTEFLAHSYSFRDRLFKNDGKGRFTLDPEAIPEVNISGSVVTAADYDHDGDLDLFVGGRIIPQAYPLPERSILLENERGNFTDVTQTASKEFMELGMVTSALWTDYDQDGWVDLMVTGEWMPVRMFRNEKGKFREVSSELGLDGTEGWWNSIQSGDFNLDGDIDYILGNQGLNNRYSTSREKPVYVFAKDFDNNGVIDPVINAWMNGDYYPVHLRNDQIHQMQFLKTRYPRFIDYSQVRSDSLFTPEEREGALELQAKIFDSVLLNREQDESYSLKPLPFNAQFAPIQGLLCADYDHDNFPDLLMIGNNYTTESFNGIHDAFIGLFMRGDRTGQFHSERPYQSGFFVDGDGRALITLFGSDIDQLVIASQNAESLKAFRFRDPSSDWVRFSPGKTDQVMLIYFRDGQVQRHEFYYGSSYLSQNTRDLLINRSVTEKLLITDYSGVTREVRF